MDINISENKVDLDINGSYISIEPKTIEANINIEQTNPIIEIDSSTIEVEEDVATIYEKDHKNLDNLDYENSGHTGFQPAGDYVLKGEVPETLYALGADYAEYFEWEDGNPDKEDRTSLFVSIVNGTRKIRKARVGDDILGITSIDASVIGNAGYKDDERYSAVGMTGVMKVKADEYSVVGEYVVPGNDGIAIPSDNNAGYKVTARYSESLIEVLMAHDAEMISRIIELKADRNEIPDVSEFITSDVRDLDYFYNVYEIDELLEEKLGDIEALLSEV